MAAELEKVRAKFRVNNVGNGSVNLSAVNSGSVENEAFFKGAPMGTIQLSILNSESLKAFENGVEYFVDFTRAPVIEPV